MLTEIPLLSASCCSRRAVSPANLIFNCRRGLNFFFSEFCCPKLITVVSFDLKASQRATDSGGDLRRAQTPVHHSFNLLEHSRTEELPSGSFLRLIDDVHALPLRS